MRTMGRAHSLFGVGLGVLAVGLMAAVARSPAPTSGAGRSAMVRPSPLAPLPLGIQEQKGAGQRALKVPGTVVAAEEARLVARISGIVQKVQVDIGDRVKAGQVLAELAVPDLEATLMQKKARVVQAEAEIQQAQRLLREATASMALIAARVQEAEAAVKAALARLKFRMLQHERLQQLFKKGELHEQIITEAAEKVGAARAAQAEVDSKLRVVKAMREGATAKRATVEAGVKVAQAKLDVAQADAQRVMALLQYARIVAPFDGIVTQRSVSRGDFAAPPRGRAAPLFVVARVDSVRVVVAVPDRDAARLKIGTPATVQLDALPGQTFKGKVARTAGVLDPARRTLRVEIDLPNGDGKLLPGMYGTVTLDLHSSASIDRNFWIDLGSGQQYFVGVQQPEKRTPSAPKVPPALAKERLDTARKTYEGYWLRLRNRQSVGPETIYTWSLRWLRAQQALGAGKAGKPVALQAHLDRMKDLEKLWEAYARTGQGSQTDADAAQYFRIEAEIWLAQVKGK